MLYPLLVEYYLFFVLALFIATWFARRATPPTRRTLLFVYGVISLLGFTGMLDWLAGVVFGLLVLELGRSLRAVLDKKLSDLESK